MQRVTWERRRAYLRALKQKMGEPLGGGIFDENDQYWYQNNQWVILQRTIMVIYIVKQLIESQLESSWRSGVNILFFDTAISTFEICSINFNLIPSVAPISNWDFQIWRFVVFWVRYHTYDIMKLSIDSADSKIKIRIMVCIRNFGDWNFCCWIEISKRFEPRKIIRLQEFIRGRNTTRIENRTNHLCS